MRANLLERRLEMVKLRSSGFPLSYTVNNLARKYEVSTRAVYKDYQNRKTWLKGILEMKDPETFFLGLLARHEEIYKKAAFEHLKADNSSARVGALNLMRNINKDFVEMVVLQGFSKDLGEIEEKLREMGKLETSADTTANRLH